MKRFCYHNIISSWASRAPVQRMSFAPSYRRGRHGRWRAAWAAGRTRPRPFSSGRLPKPGAGQPGWMSKLKKHVFSPPSRLGLLDFKKKSTPSPPSSLLLVSQNVNINVNRNANKMSIDMSVKMSIEMSIARSIFMSINMSI